MQTQLWNVFAEGDEESATTLGSTSTKHAAVSMIDFEDGLPKSVVHGV